MNNDYEYNGTNEDIPSFQERNNFTTNNMNIKPPNTKRKWPLILLLLLLVVVGILIYLTFFTDKLDFIKQDDKYSEFDPDRGKIESNSNEEIKSNKSSNSNKLSNNNVEVSSVSITPTAPSVIVGNTITLKVNVMPSGAKDKIIVWKSSDTKIAKVNSKGMVTGVKTGTATITATSKNGKKASVKVIVTNKLVPVTGLNLSASVGKVYEGKKLAIKANVIPSNATNQGLIYKSSDNGIATISSSGVITGIAPGAATITVTTKDGNFSKKYNVTVLEADVQSISFDIEGAKTIRLGSKYKPKIIFTPSTAINGLDLTWTVRDSGYINLDKDGTITPIKEGMTYVTATTSNGKSAKLKIFTRLTPTDYNIKFTKVKADQCVFSLVDIKNNVEIIDFEYIKYNSKLYYPSAYQSIPCSNINTDLPTVRWKSSGEVGYDSNAVYVGF